MPPYDITMRNTVTFATYCFYQWLSSVFRFTVCHTLLIDTTEHIHVCYFRNCSLFTSLMAYKCQLMRHPLVHIDVFKLVSKFRWDGISLIDRFPLYQSFPAPLKILAESSTKTRLLRRKRMYERFL